MLLRCENLEPPMSLSGQTRTSSFGGRTSASAECRHWSGRAVRWSSCASSAEGQAHRAELPQLGDTRGGNSHPYPEQFRFARRTSRPPCGRLNVRETDFREGKCPCSA
jgi:hypothetical protein